MSPLTDYRAWLSPRHLRFWIVVCMVLYTLAGFFLVPWVIQRELPAFAQDLVQRPASVAAVRFNPWTLALEADNLELRDTDASDLISVGQLRVNLQVASLFRRALVFREVTLVEPTITLVRDGFTDTNLGRLAAAASGPDEPVTEPEADTGLLRLVIAQLQIDGGVVDVTDKMPATPFNTRLAPINIEVKGLSTLPNEVGEQIIRIRTEGDGLIEWEGSLQINPLRSDGRIALRLPGLPLATRYLDDVLDFDLDGGQLDLAFDYAVQGLPDGLFRLAVNELNLNISATELATEDNAEPFLGFGNLRVTGGQLRLPEARGSMDELVITRPTLQTWLREDGSLNLLNLLEERADALPASEAEPSVEEPGTPAEPAPAAQAVAQDAAGDDDAGAFTVELGSLRIEDMAASFEDRTLPEPGRVAIEALNLQVRNISNTPGASFPFDLDLAITSGGAVKAAGEASVLPTVAASATVNVEKLALGVAQPWVDQAIRMTIDAGTLTANTQLLSAPDETLDLRGGVTIDGLKLDDPDGTELLTWQQLELEDLIYQLDSSQLEIARMRLREPFARVLIDAERNLNFSKLVVAAPADDEPPAAAAGEPLVFRMGTSFIENGSMEFADLSLPLPFSTPIQEFGGSISTLASDTREPSELDFEGRVGEFGQAKVTGQLVVFDPLAQANVRVAFRNVNMPNLSPYTVDFAGRKIADGKLNLDLDYSLDQGQLLGRNAIVIEKIKLGEKVDNPDALDLPLGLAVALLSDANGVIDVKLNVEGNANDPEFSARGAIGKALANLLTKIVTSPFRLLGGLVGGGAQADLQNVAFEPGEARLSPPVEEQLTQLGTALAQRPALQLQVHGAYAAEVDREGLATARVKAAIEAEVDAADGGDALLADRARDAMEKLARERLPDLSLRDLRTQFAVTDDDPDTPEIDTIAYLTELQSRLIAAEPVAQDELLALGDARAGAIADYLATQADLAPQRVRVTETIAVDPGAENAILIRLELDAAG